MQTRLPPLGLTLLTLVIWASITLLMGLVILPPGTNPLEEIGRAPAWQILTAGLFALLVARLARWRSPILGRPAPRSLRLAWFPMLYILVLLGGAIATGLPPLQTTAILALNCLFVGFSEELMFRGLVFPALRRHLSVWPAVVIGAALFGAIHVLNALMTGYVLLATTQAIAAMISGLLLTALLLRTGALWVSMLYHALWDFSLLMVQQGVPMPDQPIEDQLALPLLLFVLPNGLWALWLMRHAGRYRLPGDPAPVSA